MEWNPNPAGSCGKNFYSVQLIQAVHNEHMQKDIGLT
jgi:hypothetical protein